MKIVEVAWTDACAAEGWGRTSKLDPCEAVNVGILVSRDKEAIHLISALNSSDQIGGRFRIPTGMIRSVRVVGTVKGIKVVD